MKRFTLLNTIFGWVAFAIATVTYLLTIEPTASFWDCGEFISTAYKLDVGHPPGAPFFMLTGRFFSLFATDPTQVSVMINAMSAILSAFTILFLFWTITHLAQKVLIKSEDDYNVAHVIGILGAGMVGALVYTFSDTFWFSAVEGEVYAYSSFFTAVVFWLILKWEKSANKVGSDRWLILIAYLMGISIGVHLLNLLTIPALVLVYYFKNYTPSVKGILWVVVIAMAILGTVLYGLIPGFVQMACWSELFFVNIIGLPFNTGVYVNIVLTIGLFAWAIYESSANKSFIRIAISFISAITMAGIPFFGESVIVGLLLIIAMAVFFYYKKAKIDCRWLHTILLMVTVLLIGYSSYAVILIRSAAKPTMDQNSPDNVFILKYYLNREQYGDKPLLYGQVYNAPEKLRIEGNMCIPEQKQTSAFYAPKQKENPSDKDEYIILGYKTKYVMDERFNVFFPRMYSREPHHVRSYKSWVDIKGKTIYYDYCGQEKSEVIPTFGENLKFFFSYQINFMYWRYFLWNFSGRQNDMQGNGEVDQGNWITGIPFIDKLMLGGDDAKMPTQLVNNKGRNTYFLLPLLLGILGIVFLIFADKKGLETFWMIMLLFFLTGIAIVIYMNQTPLQPRERDYAYAGSFYAFSIWIGLGVLGVVQAIEKYLHKTLATVVATVACLCIPALMAQQNWDDHDRSNRYVARDFGANYLSSCKPNAIIFTNGDNDTFPLWYNQEVEGYRTDVRVCNLSYLATDWYIAQMKRGAYDSKPLPISWKKKDFSSPNNESMQVDSIVPQLDVKTAMDFILSDDAQTKNEGNPFVPTNKLVLAVDPQQVVKTGTIAANRITEVLPQIEFKLKRGVTRAELMIIDMLTENKWKRPIYFAISVGDEYYLGLNDHFESTGLAYQVLPIGAPGSGIKTNTEEMYENMMKKFKYGNIADPSVYLNEDILRMCRTHRMMFVELISSLLSKGDSTRALKALDYCNKVIPERTVTHDYSSTQLADYYYKLRKPKQATDIMKAVAKDCIEHLDWYFSFDSARRSTLTNKIEHNLAVLGQVIQTCEENKQKTLVDKYMARYMEYAKRLQM